MIERIKTVVAAAASLVLVGGLAIGLALNQAGQQEGVACGEWSSSIHTWQDKQQDLTAFVAVKTGTVIPKAINDRLLGDCFAGVCTVKPDACDGAVTYTYQCGPLVNLGAPGSWRICEVKAPPYFVGAWKQVAEANTTTFKFYGGFGEAVEACRAVTSNANCLSLFGEQARCWILDNGDVCRYGKLYGPGKGGDEACPQARIVKPMPCTVERGAGSEIQESNRVIQTGELEAAFVTPKEK